MFTGNLSILFPLIIMTLITGNPDRELFISPVKIPLLLSANFAEIRSDHFHSGIDIRTQGVTGHEIVAAASGYVYRVSVSPGGFGKALYLRHPSGHSTVYGHLDSFTPEIEEYVRDAQYANRNFTVNLFPPRDKFTFRQGQTIAWSGNTGSSSGPHLHYEIRRSDSEIPLDPLTFEFGVSDNIKPVIESLVIYPADPSSSINGRNQELLIPVQGGHGNYYVRSDRQICISGFAGFGIRTYDLLNDSWNRCGVYSIELSIDGETYFLFEMDKFSFDETRYVNSHIDYSRKVRDNITIQKTFVAPNDRLSAYRVVKDRGIFEFGTDTLHNIRIISSDSHGNSSVLSFRVRSESGNRLPVNASTSNGRLLQYDKPYWMSDGDITVAFTENSFYDNIVFTYGRTERPESLYSDIFSILDRFTPIHNTYRLSIKPKVAPPSLQSKMTIVSVNENGSYSFIGGEWSGDYLVADTRNFGRFSVGIDTVPPDIKANGFRSGIDLTGRKSIRFNITDDMSGIQSYEAFIDNNWALLEYDPKNTLIVHNFDERRTAKGTNHNLLLRVTDNRNNVTELNAEFRW